MNKVVIARILATILGLFLIVITAIKFDWVGMVSRGDSIIQFNTEKKQEDHVVEEKVEEEKVAEEITKNEVEISCTKAVSENNVFVTHTLTSYFVNDTINTSTLDVKVTYTDPTRKGAFDTLVQNYTNLYTAYNGLEGLTVSTIPGTTEFQYHQDIYYESVDEASLTTKGLPALEPVKNITIDDLQKNYTNQGYTCTQH